MSPNLLSEMLHEKLHELILETSAGDRLLSEPKLAQQFGVSRATLREAMRTFETQGFIYRRQGVGTFVIHPSQVIETGLEELESIHSLAKQIGLHVEMGAYQFDRRDADKDEREIFGLPRGDKVVEVTWVMEAESRPAAYLVDILPESVLSLDTLHRDFNGSVLDLLLDRDDFSLTTSRTEINAVAAEPEIAKALGIQRRDVVLYFEAHLYSGDGRVVDCSYSYYLPGYFKFHVIRRVGQGRRRTKR